MSNTDLTKIKGQTPVSIIVHGGTYIGFLLAKTLLEQGSQVVIIDRYTSKSKEYFSILKKSGKVSFIDFKGLKNFYEKIARIDYMFYLLGDLLERKNSVDSKDFLSETDYLGSSLTSAHKFKAKVSLVTSLRLNRELSNRVNNERSGKSSPYTTLELQRYAENFVAEYVDKTKSNVRILRLGTVLGKGVENLSDNVLDKLFTDATQKPQIEILGEGLEVHNLIHESDAIYGILKLTFDDKTKGEVISLCNKNDYTTLSLAYKLLELDVESKAIRFVERTDTDSVLQDLYTPAPNASDYSWKQRIALEESVIEQAKSYYAKSDKKWDVSKAELKKEKKELSTVSKTKLGLFLYNIFSPIKQALSPEKFFSEISYTKIFRWLTAIVVSIIAIYYFLSPILGISLSSYLIYSETKNIKISFEKLDFETIGRKAPAISNNIVKIENNLSRLYWLFNLTNSKEMYRSASQLIQGSKYAMDSASDLVLGLQPLGEYIKDFKPALTFDSATTSTTREYREYLLAMNDNQYNLREGIYKMSLAQSLIDSVNTKGFPKYLQNFVLEYKGTIEDVNNAVLPLEKVVQFLPDLLGVNERQRYLILLQNDGEIRSSGGWITSYAVLAIEGGQIRELFVDDIYNAEGTLKIKGHSYKTPTSMIRALSDIPYTFSLINWNPNLDSIMTDSEQFIYDLGKGNDIDGIITIDTVFLQKLLDRWGGVEVPGESEIITSTNLYQKIFEMHTEFTPGSTRKSSFLANLANKTVTKLLSSSYAQYKDVADIIIESLEEKHIQATFKNSIARSYFDSKNWDGNLDSKYQGAPINIDWDWGGNKANLYIKKNHTLDINIRDEKSIDYRYQVAIQNDSTSNEYPQGEYKNYIRIFIPSSATILGIVGIDDNRYDIYNEGGYKVVGGWFNIPPKGNKTFEISYRISESDSLGSFLLSKTDTHYTLNLNIYKQPGSKKDAYNLNVIYPENWTVENSDSLSSIGNQLNKRFELDRDQSFDISWQR